MSPDRTLQSAGLSSPAPTPPDPLTLDAAGVAALLGLPFPQQFLTRRARLQAKGFPRPLPMTPLRWSRAAVERWVEQASNAHGAPAPAAATPPEPPRNPTVVALENYGRAA